MLLLPTSLLAIIICQASVSAAERSPTAIRKLPPDANEKLFPEHLAFAPLSFAAAAIAAHKFLEAQDAAFNLDLQHAQLSAGNRPPSSQPRPYRPAFAGHFDDSEANVLRRAAEALALLERRAACPSGMSGCDAIGQPNKCCQTDTICTKVDDVSVGGIACCPQGSSCGGKVGACPSGAVSCPADLGGGCCIPGYVCQGLGCVPSASATAEQTTKTVVATSTHTATPQTITTTKTTWVDGTPSTVIVTEIVTVTSSHPPTTQTTTETVTGGAPWRQTDTSTTTVSTKDSKTSSQSTTATTATTQDTSTQLGCPTGFYGCLATHGGGCCQTDRDCHTHSCPPQASTTIVSDGRTVVVLATDVPSVAATSTCAVGWFLCGSDAGARAGCCPSGYDCGTASCFTVSASQTSAVQKVQPKTGDGYVRSASSKKSFCAAAVVLALRMLL